MEQTAFTHKTVYIRVTLHRCKALKPFGFYVDLPIFFPIIHLDYYNLNIYNQYQ